jgi:hypothetical protein
MRFVFALATAALFASSVGLLAQHSTASHSGAHQHAKREHKAHDHGSAKLDVAIEGQTVTADFEAAADPIIGFEYAPKTAADKAKVAAALSKLKTSAMQIVSLPASAACKVVSSDAHHEVESSAVGQETHSEVHAEFKFQCAKSLKGAKLSSAASKLYPEIEEVQVQLVSGSQQAGATIKKGAGSLQIQ